MPADTFRTRDLRGRPGFAQVYEAELAAAAHWPSADFRVYVALLVFCAGATGWAVSWGRIATITGLHRDTVRASVARLRSEGVIAVRTRFRAGRQTSNEIQIFGPELSTEGGLAPPHEGGPGTPQTIQTWRTRSRRTTPPSPQGGVRDEHTLTWVKKTIEDQRAHYGWGPDHDRNVIENEEFRALTVRQMIAVLKRAPIPGVSRSFRRLEAALRLVVLP